MVESSLRDVPGLELDLSLPLSVTLQSHSDPVLRKSLDGNREKSWQKAPKLLAPFFWTLAISPAIFEDHKWGANENKHRWVPPQHTLLMGCFCQVGPMLGTSLRPVRLKQLPFLCSPIITFPREDPEGVIISTTTWIIYSNFPSSRDSQNSLAWSQRSQLFQGFSLLLPSILGTKHPPPAPEAAELRLSTQSHSGPTRGDRSSSEVRSHHPFRGKFIVGLFVQADFLHISRRAANELQVTRQVPRRPRGWDKQYPSDFQLNLPGWKSDLIVFIGLYNHMETQRKRWGSEGERERSEVT